MRQDPSTTVAGPHAVAVTAIAETTYTFGSTADTWGRSWSAGEISTANFRVRLIDALHAGDQALRSRLRRRERDLHAVGRPPAPVARDEGLATA